MKKISILVSIYFFSFLPAFSQPTKPEMDKRIKEVQNDVSDSSSFLLTPRNIKLLNALPIRTFNRAELISYLHNLNLLLTELIRSGYGKDIAGIPDIAVTKAATGIGLWINREPEK